MQAAQPATVLTPSSTALYFEWEEIHENGMGTTLSPILLRLHPRGQKEVDLHGGCSSEARSPSLVMK